MTGWGSFPPQQRSVHWRLALPITGASSSFQPLRALGVRIGIPTPVARLSGSPAAPVEHKSHRAVVEAITFQVRDVVDAMSAASGTPVRNLRVDGGASVMDQMLQLQADQLGVHVLRPTDQETTALRRGLSGRPGRRRVAVNAGNHRPMAARCRICAEPRSRHRQRTARPVAASRRAQSRLAVNARTPQ